MAQGRKSLNEWVAGLGDLELPALTSVVQELNDLAMDRGSIADQLAEVILRDATFTTQVLRIANSVHYNRGNPPITTISRAVVLLGFEQIREICISIRLIESLLGENPREHLLESLAESFHAAVQARNLARSMKVQHQEEIFISALLMRLGELAFWSTEGDPVESVHLLIARDGLPPEEAAERALGFSFRRLTRQLARDWRFGDLLQDALKQGGAENPSVQVVRLGEEISRVARDGWSSPAVDELIEHLVEFTGDSPERVREWLADNAGEAAAVAATYGAGRICHLIPSAEAPPPDPPVVVEEAPPGPDPTLQLQVMGELSAMAMEKVDVNVLFQTVLEGMHRGIGLERVLVALCEPRTGMLAAKYVFGTPDAGMRERFRFRSGADAGNVFAWVLHHRRAALHVGPQADHAVRDRVLPEIQAVTGVSEFFVAPLFISARPIGLLYADHGTGKRSLEFAEFVAFQNFSNQANLCLGMLAAGNQK